MPVRQAIELLDREKQSLGRQRRTVRVALYQAVTVARVLPEALERGLQVAVQHDRGVVADVVEHRGRVIEEEGQVILDACRGHAVADVLVDTALGRVTLEQLTPAAAEFGPGLVVHRELAAGQQADLGYGVEAALAVGVESTYRVDLV